MYLGTASSTSAAVLQLAESIVPGKLPTLIPVVPDRAAEALDCFYNAARVAGRDGGSVVYGWALYEWPGKLVEAQFHAVVRRPDGSLMDVTPSDDDSRETLFLEDSTRTFVLGTLVLSRQLQVGKNPNIRRYIKTFSDYQQMDAKYFVDEGPGGLVGVDVPPGDRMRYAGLEQLLGLFRQRIGHPTADYDLEPGTPCPCCSGRPFQMCHGL